MTVHLQKKIEGLKKRVTDLGARVEENLRDALRAVEDRDPELGRRVITADETIDDLEIELEEECLAILALEQPVAFDLRFVVSTLKMNNDLERIGDLAANIGEQAIHLAEEPRIEPPPFDLASMARLCEKMLGQALDALVNVDLAQALDVIDRDDEVDAIYAGMFTRFREVVGRHPEQLLQLMRLLNVARQLERTADHAVNIAEDVVYFGRGEIVRHGAHQELEDLDEL